MITYAYWIGLVVLAAGALWVLAGLAGLRRTGIAVALAILAIGAGAYYFRYQQLFVKQYGGVMSVTNKAGRRFLSATWKDDHLWLLTFDPRNDTCYFEEYSKGNMLEGKVTIRNCDPLLPPAAPAP